MSEEPEVSTAVKVRRYVAIGLIALLILFMFVLPIIGINPYSDAFSSSNRYYQYLQSGDKDLFANQYAYEWATRHRSYYDPTLTIEGAHKLGEQLYDALHNKGVSFMKMLTLMPDLMRYEDAPSAARVAVAVILYFFFFAILLFAVAAIPMTLFNKSKVFHILLLVFSMIVGMIFLFFGICGPIAVMASEGSLKVSPVNVGAASILIPVLSLAALIVYKRAKKPRPAPVVNNYYSQQNYQPQYPPQNYQPQYPPQNYQPQYPPQNYQPQYPPQNYQPQYPPQNYGQPYPQQDYRQPYPQQEAESEPALWTCQVCGAKNPSTSMFCPNCGTEKE